MIRRALTRVYDGSGDLLWELARGLVTSHRGETLVRWAMLAAGLWVWWLIIGAWPELMAALAALWCVAAWRRADAEEAEEEAQQAAAAQERQLLLDELYLQLILRTIGDRTGVHLSELLPAFQRFDPDRLEYATAQDLRVLLDALGVPVQRKIRVGRRTGVPGVRAQDAREALRRYFAHGPSPLA